MGAEIRCIKASTTFFWWFLEICGRLDLIIRLKFFCKPSDHQTVKIHKGSPKPLSISIEMVIEEFKRLGHGKYIPRKPLAKASVRFLVSQPAVDSSHAAEKCMIAEVSV